MCILQSYACRWAQSNEVCGPAESGNGYSVVARALAHAGINTMFGVIGIPVTELASAAQVHLPLCNAP